MSRGLEHELRAAGEKVSEGHFRIDAARALEKLRKFRLADPHHWVLEVLRAAAASGAKRVDVRTTGSAVEVAFDGRPFPRDVMARLLEHALTSTGSAEDDRARLLSLGVAGALGLAPRRVLVRSGGTEVDVRPPAEAGVSKADGAGTRVRVEKGASLGALRKLVGRVPEALVVRERAVRFPAELWVDGKRVDGGPRFQAEFLAAAEKTVGGLSAWVGFPVKEAPEDRVVLDVGGVVVASRTRVQGALGVRAWVSCADLRRNASGSDVVDSDPRVAQAMDLVEVLTAAALTELVEALQKTPKDGALRERLVRLALRQEVPAALVAVLHRAPLIPGPAGEWASPDDFVREVRAKRPLRFSTARCPKGSYPEPCFYSPTPNADRLLPLLPAPPTRDVKDLVRARARAAENRARWLEAPQETPTLPGDAWLATAPVKGRQTQGVLALERAGTGAFVRLLSRGRFVQEGEIASLAPLDVRAVVDWDKDVPEKLWVEVPSRKLWSAVAHDVEVAATTAILEVLEAERPSREALRHGRALLARLAEAGPGRALPAPLRRAPLFADVDGTRVSLDGLAARPRWRYVGSRWPDPLLSGEPLLLLDPEDLELLKRLDPGRLEDAAPRLALEQVIRRRMRGPRQAARLEARPVKVNVAGEGVRGEATVSAAAGREIEVKLLRDGVLLEVARLPARYGPMEAVVDAPGLTPDGDWTHAVRDAAFAEVEEALRQAERALAAAVVAEYSDEAERMGEACAQWVVGFAKKELRGGDGSLDPLAAAVRDAPLFRASHGRASLAQVQACARRDGAVLVASGAERLEVPADLLVLWPRTWQLELLEAVVDAEVQDAAPVLERARRAAAHRAQPPRDPRLPPGAPLRTPVRGEGVVGELGLALDDEPRVRAVVLVEQREFSSTVFTSPLPGTAVVDVQDVDPALQALPADAETRLAGALQDAGRAVVRAALADPAAEGARKALAFALAASYAPEKEPELGRRLAKVSFFPCTDGRPRSAEELSKGPLHFVTRPLQGTPRSKVPVVVATDPLVARALRRWPKGQDVTESLAAEFEARERRQKLQPATVIALSVPGAWRRGIARDGVEGEVAVVGPERAGQVEVFHERRLLTTVQGALAGPFAAAVNDDRLLPEPGHAGVVQDGAWKALLGLLGKEAEGLAEDVGLKVAALPPAELQERHGVLLPLAVWLAARKRLTSPLLALPLLRKSDGTAASLGELLAEHKRLRTLRWSSRGGTLLRTDRWVWWPREGERELLEPLKLTLQDATEDLAHADTVRARPRFDTVRAPIEGPWREPVHGKAVEGEVALPETPTGLLRVDLLSDHVRLEQWSSEHPVGAEAQVSSTALRPNATWTKAIRNQAFRDTVAAVEGALERLLARRVAAPDRDAAWRAWVLAALRWNPSRTGPLAEALGQLPLFEDLQGRPVTVGAVLALQAEKKVVSVATPGAGTPDETVLALGEDALRALEALAVKVEDVTPLLTRARELEAQRRARRLKALAWPGDALVRLDFIDDGVRGQLALPRDAHAPVELTLARDGVAVCPAEFGDFPAVAGVADDPSLETDEAWLRAKPSAALRGVLLEQVEALHQALADRAASLEGKDREQAALHALRYLAWRGMQSAAHLDRLAGAAQALAAAPLLRTARGSVVSLRVVAEEVLRRGAVAVITPRFFKPDVGDALVLEAARLDAPVVRALYAVLGKLAVDAVQDLEAWRRRQAERDPEPHDPLHEGLRRLRAELRLLRAGALGQATPDELADVKLVHDGQVELVHYEARRKLALLDARSPLVQGALASARTRPERLYVLLAAIYGAVNRELERITDDHEAELALALAAHLAANPKALQPKDPDAG